MWNTMHSSISDISSLNTFRILASVTRVHSKSGAFVHLSCNCTQSIEHSVKLVSAISVQCLLLTVLPFCSSFIDFQSLWPTRFTICTQAHFADECLCIHKCPCYTGLSYVSGTVWLSQLVRSLAAPTHVHSCVQEVEGFNARSRQSRFLITLLDR